MDERPKRGMKAEHFLEEISEIRDSVLGHHAGEVMREMVIFQNLLDEVAVKDHPGRAGLRAAGLHVLREFFAHDVGAGTGLPGDGDGQFGNVLRRENAADTRNMELRFDERSEFLETDLGIQGVHNWSCGIISAMYKNSIKSIWKRVCLLRIFVSSDISFSKMGEQICTRGIEKNIF